MAEPREAYRRLFAVTEADASRVLSLLAAHANNINSFTRYTARREFGGHVIELATDSTAVLQALDAMRLHPPAPWLAFPDLDAGGTGSLQGSLDYWWNWLWMPYWTDATQDEREHWLALASDDWREFIELHV